VTVTRDAFQALVESARADHPLWFDLPTDETADPESLDFIEQDLGATLPDDYRWFLSTFGGGDFAFARLYSGDRNSDLFLLANQPKVRRDFVAVSDDGTGNLIGFPVLGGMCQERVMFLDHETESLRPSEIIGFLEFVARSGLQEP